LQFGSDGAGLKLNVDHQPQASANSSVKAFLIFALHQFIGTLGVGFIAYMIGYSTFKLLGQVSNRISMRDLYWILTETRYYPVQIVFGFWYGWWLGRRWHHHSMVWVWVLPFAILCYAIGTNFTGIPEWASAVADSLPGQSGLSHYFGSGCHPSNHCLDQLIITMPFCIAPF